MPLKSLKKKAHVEHGVRICGIGGKCAVQADNRFVDAALFVEDIGEVVPGQSEIRISLDGRPIGGLRVDVAAARTQHISEVERSGRIGGIHFHQAPIETFSCPDFALRFGRLGLFKDRLNAVGWFFDIENELASRIGAAFQLFDKDAGRTILEKASDWTGPRREAICESRGGFW